MCGICGLGYFVRHEQDWPTIDEPLSINAEDRGGSFGGKPSYTIEGAAGTIARAGLIWGSGPGAVVTFAFRDTAPSSMPSDTSGFSRFNNSQIEQTLLALQSWSDVANIVFQRVGAGYSDNATILFGNYSSGVDGAAAFASLPGNAAVGSASGDVWINSSLWYNSAPGYLNYGRLTLAHEIGHAIGLLHPGDYNASAENSPTYADADYREDTRQFSIMSYWNEGITGASFQGSHPAAPLLDDIAAIQLIYGANMSARAGNTVYGFNSNTGRDFYTATDAGSPLIFAVWDGGGYDTLNFSGYAQNQLIDLRQGHFSNVGGLVGNVAIAQGVVIERAIGGSGNDIMYAASTPIAIAVADLVKAQGQVIASRGTALSLDGAFGLQFDAEIISSTTIPHATVQATGSGTHEWYRFTAGAGETVTIDIDGTSGLDTVVRIYDAAGRPLAQNDDGPVDVGSTVRQDSFLSFTLPAAGVYYIVVGAYAGAGSGGYVDYSPIPAGQTYTLNVSLTGAAAPVSGYEGSRLEGGAGNDQLHGGLGNDILIGGDGDDWLYTGAGGNDNWLLGGAGDDVYIIDTAGARVTERAGEGYDQVLTSVSFSGAGQHIEYFEVTGTRNANIVANDLDNVIIGNNAANVIKGGAGDDYMEGRGGNDTYYVDSRGDVVVEVAGGGIDTVYTTVSFDARQTHVENITILGRSNANAVANDLNNIIIGNSANNIIIGYGGGDVLTGGGGSDTFRYTAVSDSSYSNYDRIMDLGADDFIDLRAVDANVHAAGNQAFNRVDAFTGQAGQLVLTWLPSAGFTLLAMDVDGDGVADMRIVLYGNHSEFDNFLGVIG
ncbi:MAG: M10 family metallopeptidase C-terminal domain-containing protein [Brevundimonas sp.]|uniref:M10 family metallopeptidase C-terminal domain-containing protein n=1 Tax=Brevundimonas sp. TaxID=1871086 RepID=UPI00391DA5CC